MPSVTFQLAGDQAVREKFARLGINQTRDLGRQLTLRMAALFYREILARVPSRSGALAANVKLKQLKNRIGCSAQLVRKKGKAPYAIHVELGHLTGKRTARRRVYMGDGIVARVRQGRPRRRIPGRFAARRAFRAHAADAIDLARDQLPRQIESILAR